ncbi:MAG: trehalose-phosphatase [Erythrobacter sp.]|uniref:trehalose-phosphatase n=1 Tax=Erythrobacter sp. TaxID=1042 RepID=UPI0032EFEADE
MDSGLAQRSPPRLADLLDEGPTALFLDFDGTLVEIAPGPDAIAPRAGLADALGRLADRLEGRLAVISGRAIHDIERHIGALGIAAAGSHGTDIRTAAGEPLGEGPAGLPDAISSALRGFAEREGLAYEAKPHGGALHYRSAPGRGEDAHAFASKLAEAHGWKVQGGKGVVELVARGASKGGAVDLFMDAAPFAGARPFFIGDDLTDEAGFEVCEARGGAGIIVGDREPTAARYRLGSVGDVHAWLGL